MRSINSALHTRTARRLARGGVALSLGLAALVAGGCSNAGEGAISGATLGALGGMALGSLSGNMGEGAAAGAVIGGIGGAIIGDQNERAERRSRDVYRDSYYYEDSYGYSHRDHHRRPRPRYDYYERREYYYSDCPE